VTEAEEGRKEGKEGREEWGEVGRERSDPQSNKYERYYRPGRRPLAYLL